MGKDPAFMFYPEKFITGTKFMSDKQIGKYIILLCIQHQAGGIIDKDDFNDFVGNDKKIRSKFIETEDGFFNERMMKEIEKRKKKSENLSQNAKKRWLEHKQKQCNGNAIACDLHMPIKDKDIDKDKDVNKREDLKDLKEEVIKEKDLKDKDPSTQKTYSEFIIQHSEKWTEHIKTCGYFNTVKLDIEKFRDDIDKLQRLDHVSEENLVIILNFLHNNYSGKNGFTWAKQIGSPGKLRKRAGDGRLYSEIVLLAAMEAPAGPIGTKQIIADLAQKMSRT